MKKRTLIIGFVLIACLVYFKYPHILLKILYAQLDAEQQRVVNLTPIKKQVLSRKPSEFSNKVFFDSVSLSTDWVEDSSKETEYSKFYNFKNGNIIVITLPEGTPSLYSGLISQDDQRYDIDKFKKTLNKLNIDSDHKAFTYMANLTSSDTKFWISRDIAAINFTLIALKPTIFLETDEIITYEVNGYTVYKFKPIMGKNTYGNYVFDTKGNCYMVDFRGDTLEDADVLRIMSTIEINSTDF